MGVLRAGTKGLALLAVAPLFVASTARAQRVGEFAFEVYGGPFFPGLTALDTNLTYGARFGARPLPQLGWNVELGGVQLEPINQLPTSVAVQETNAYFVDGDGVWYVGGSGFGIFAGLGLGHVDMTFRDAPDRSENALTFSGGVHYAWNLAGNLLLKPEFRLRWWQGSLYHRTDEEYTASVGWHF